MRNATFQRTGTSGNPKKVQRSSSLYIPQGGVVLVTEDVGEKLLPKFAQKADDMGVHVAVVPNGTIEQLRELVTLVAEGDVSTAVCSTCQPSCRVTQACRARDDSTRARVTWRHLLLEKSNCRCYTA